MEDKSASRSFASMRRESQQSTSPLRKSKTIVKLILHRPAPDSLTGTQQCASRHPSSQRLSVLIPEEPSTDRGAAVQEARGKEPREELRHVLKALEVA